MGFGIFNRTKKLLSNKNFSDKDAVHKAIKSGISAEDLARIISRENKSRSSSKNMPRRSSTLTRSNNKRRTPPSKTPSSSNLDADVKRVGGKKTRRKVKKSKKRKTKRRNK